MPAFEFALPPGAKNIKIKTGTQEIAVEPTYYRHSKDGAIPIVALFGGDEFVGEVLEGTWSPKKMHPSLLEGKIWVEDEKIKMQGRSETAGNSRYINVPTLSRVPLLDDLILEVQLAVPVSSVSANRFYFSLLIVKDKPNGSAEAVSDWVRLRVQVETEANAGVGDGTFWTLDKRVNETITNGVFSSSKSTITSYKLKLIFEEQKNGHEHTHLYVDTGSGYSEVNGSPFTLGLNFSVGYLAFELWDSTGSVRLCTSDFIRVTYPDFKVVYDLDDDAFQGEGEELLKKAWDTSGNGNHGVVYGATWVRDGKFGKALSFDGSDDYVDSGNIPDLGQEFTVVLWSKRLGNTGVYGALISIDGSYWSTIGGFLIFDNNSGVIKGRIRNDASNTETAVTLETSVPNNVWRFYAVVWDKPTLKGYRNGKLVDSETWDYDIGWNVFKTHIGRWTGDYFYGLIDEVRIYNRALSESEIQTLYNGGTVTDGLVGEWKFDGGNNRGEVVVWDTMGSSDEDDWVRVFDPSHKFVGDLVLENGLVRFWFREDQDLRLYLWDGSSWKYIGYLNHYDGSTDDSSPSEVTLTSVSLESASVSFKLNSLSHSFTLRRGKLYGEFEITFPQGITDGWFRIVTTTGTRTDFGYAPESKIMDRVLGINGNTDDTPADNFALQFDRDENVLVFFGMNKQDNMVNNTSPELGLQAFSFTSVKPVFGAIDFSKVANLFMEAEA